MQPSNTRVDFCVYNSIDGPAEQGKQARRGKTNTKRSHSQVESENLVVEKSRGKQGLTKIREERAGDTGNDRSMDSKLQSTHVEVGGQLYRAGSLPPLFMDSKSSHQAAIYWCQVSRLMWSHLAALMVYSETGSHQSRLRWLWSHFVVQMSIKIPVLLSQSHM